MTLSLKDKLLMSLKSPYLWMVRGVIGLAGVLFDPWMFALLPLSEVVIQLWFEPIFRARLELERSRKLAKEKAALALSREDSQWYERIKGCLAQIHDRLPDMEYAPQVAVEDLARDVVNRLTTLRRAQALESQIRDDDIRSELKRTKDALAEEKSDRVKAVLEERKSLQEQRLELKKRLSGRVRELAAQLKLIEDQIGFLRDTVLSSEVQQGGALDDAAQSTLKDQIEILNRQMRICSDLDDEVHSMLRTGSSERAQTET